MKVFLAGTSFLPAYGGPAFSVSRLAVALIDAGAEVALWAADGSALATPLLPSRTKVRRLADTEVKALGAIGTPDVIHDNGLWLRHNHRLAAFAADRGIPRVVSTRGMLEPWAINHKRWKKAVAWRLYQAKDLRRARCLHATADVEAGNIERFGLGVPVRMIRNGVEIPETSFADRRPDQKVKTALFLGRIYPVKGLPMLIEAWASVRPRGWQLVIAGPDEAGHRSVIERAITAGRLDDTVSFAGPLDPVGKLAALAEAALLVLPSHSESFGMVVGEALACGVPVLATAAVPWPELVARNCGWQVAPTVAGLADGLRQATSCDTQTLATMGKIGRALVEAEFNWIHIARRFLAVYEGLAAPTAPFP